MTQINNNGFAPKNKIDRHDKHADKSRSLRYKTALLVAGYKNWLFGGDYWLPVGKTGPQIDLY